MSIAKFVSSEQAGPLKAAAATTVAQQHLQTSAYRSLHQVQCEECDDGVILKGRVSSFYLKQLAQETVRKADSSCRIVNELEVDAPRRPLAKD